ncbi:MAG TPA: hypothetical protein VJ183_10775 [Chloroflexia bacterium]|nr:hypothetical protein [Chloroflexia bacterium]
MAAFQQPIVCAKCGAVSYLQTQTCWKCGQLFASEEPAQDQELLEAPGALLVQPEEEAQDTLVAPPYVPPLDDSISAANDTPAGVLEVNPPLLIGEGDAQLAKDEPFAAFEISPAQLTDRRVGPTLECTYCGASLHIGALRCWKCGNESIVFTDEVRMREEAYARDQAEREREAIYLTHHPEAIPGSTPNLPESQDKFASVSIVLLVVIFILGVNKLSSGSASGIAPCLIIVGIVITVIVIAQKLSTER